MASIEHRIRQGRDVGVVHVGYLTVPESLRDRVWETNADGRVHEVDTMGEGARDLAFVTVTGRPLPQRPQPPDWRAITRMDAVDLLVRILAQDLAYEATIMSAEAARALAVEFLARFGETASFWTNGDPSGPLLSPFTQATFDRGVVVIDWDIAGVLWVEDED